jgi:hypothetical protein
MSWDYDAMRAWGAVVSALASCLALVIAAIAACIAWSYYGSATSETKTKLAADTVLEWSRRQPRNSRPCIDLAKSLNPDQWNEVIARHELALPELREEVLACLSDKTESELHELFNSADSKLTRRGASAIAERVNDILDADNLVASFLVRRIGNVEMFQRIGHLICRDDKPIFERLPNVPRINDSLSHCVNSFNLLAAMGALRPIKLFVSRAGCGRAAPTNRARGRAAGCRSG